MKGYGLRPENNTIARYLKNAGYKTAIFGKWHLGYEPEVGPNRHGFDEYYGLLSGNVDHYSHKEINNEDDWYEDLKPVKVDGYSTELIRDRVEEQIAALCVQVRSQEPNSRIIKRQKIYIIRIDKVK